MGKALPHKKQKNNLPRVDKHIDILILGKRDDNYQSYIDTNFSSLKVKTISEMANSLFWESNFKDNLNQIIEYMKNVEVILYDPTISEFILSNEMMMIFGIAFELNKIVYSMDPSINIFNTNTPVNSIIQYLEKDIIFNKETERKWLISEDLYNLLTKGDKKLKYDSIYDIIQFFDHHGVRYRQQKIRNTDNAIWNKNLKSRIIGNNITRNEIECNISLKEWVSKYREFKRLGLYQRPIKKIRHCKNIYGLKLELNKIKISNHSIHMIEIEYDLDCLNDNNYGLKDLLIEEGFDAKFIADNIYECTNNPNMNNKTLMMLNTDRINGGKEYEKFCLYKRKINELCRNTMTKNPKGIKIYNEK